MENLKVIEKYHGILRLLQYLDSKGEKGFLEIFEGTGLPSRQLHMSIRKAKELGLVNIKIDKSVQPRRSLVSLTEKGKKVEKKVEDLVHSL